MQPYYSKDGITIYHGDCRAVLPTIERVDLVLTDPPYGIGGLFDKKSSESGGWARQRATQTVRNRWDNEAPDPALLAAVIGQGVDAVIWGGNYFALGPSRGWLVWNKPERGFSMSEAEVAWTSRDTVIRVKDLPRSDPDRSDHPTQKPLRLMTWCLGLFPDAKTVLDPFMGSGTTLVAAKLEGRKAIGIEIEERYCEIAAKRLAQGVLPFSKAT